MKERAGRWLQRDLLRRLLLPVLGIVLLTGAATGYNAYELVEEVFDRWLLDAARSLAAQVRFEQDRAVVQLSAQAESMLRYDIEDRVSYEVVQGGRHVAGDVGLPPDGADSELYDAGARTYDGVVGARGVRIARVAVAGPGEPTVVLVAETLAKRSHAVRSLLLVLAPVAALVLLAALAIGVAVRRTVQPLERMAAQWNERSHASLDPIPAEDVPRELRPFAEALNDLLGRVRELLARERQFASTAAHQLRTPLAGLQLALARAAECPDLESTRTALAGLETRLQGTARLVQQLLTLARLDPEGRGNIALLPVDLVALAREVGEAYMDVAIARGIALELLPARPSVLVQGQPDLLREALGNLIDNAIRHTPEGGRIELAVGVDPPSISVTDSGTGVRPADRRKVFDRFVRGEGTIGEGTGLGLAIVRAIAVLHRSEVLLDAGVSRGARFVFRFPPGTESARA
jgi:two-component system, OmpR family, sensor histidine kinase TctE